MHLFKTDFKHTNAARNAVILSSLILLVYKVWKYIVRTHWGLNPGHGDWSYIEYENMNSYFRALGAIAGTFLIYRLMRNYDHANSQHRLFLLIIIESALSCYLWMRAKKADFNRAPAG